MKMFSKSCIFRKTNVVEIYHLSFDPLVVKTLSGATFAQQIGCEKGVSAAFMSCLSNSLLLQCPQNCSSYNSFKKTALPIFEVLQL